MDEASESKIPLPQWLNEIPKFGLVFIGGVYVLGLLIINIDLGRYGLINLNLGRPEYVMAGTLWVFLTLGSLGVVLVSSECIQQVTNSIREKKTKRTAGLVQLSLVILGTFLAFDYGIRILSNLRVGLASPSPETLAVYGTLALNAWTLYGTFETFKKLTDESKPLSPKTWFYATYRSFSPFYAIVLMVGALLMYASWAYPHFSKEFGGGKKPIVRLYLSEASSLSQLALPGDKTEGSIGPVNLVFESEFMFFVSSTEKIKTGWLSALLPEIGTTMGIKKELVRAVTYVRDRHSDATLNPPPKSAPTSLPGPRPSQPPLSR